MINIFKEKVRPSRIFFLSFFLLISNFAHSENIKVSKNEVDGSKFKSINELLKKDMLEKELSKKRKIEKKKKEKKIGRLRSRYNVPNEQEMWGILSELWLVRTAQELKWDFEKPDYGLDTSFATLLENIGHYEKEFKILLLNTPNVTHFSLPAGKNKYIFVLSLPFIRTMDLTKLEISILLLEDFYRMEFGKLKKYVLTKKLKKIISSNFYKKKFDKSIVDDSLGRYTHFIFKKGFSFKEQFEVTKKIDRVLKSNLQLWNSYLGVLKKIDNLIKNNSLYKGYNKIYPSPEIQISWLTSDLKT